MPLARPGRCEYTSFYIQPPSSSSHCTLLGLPCSQTLTVIVAVMLLKMTSNSLHAITSLALPLWYSVKYHYVYNQTVLRNREQ